MKQKILTISIAAYNAEKYLEKCLNSFIISDILDCIEVIIVNDGSKDNTELLAQKYTSEYPETFKLISKVNGGHGSTINTGIKYSTAKYFKAVDADDWVDKDGFVKLINYLSNNEVDLVLNNYNIVDVNGLITDHKSCVRTENFKYETILDFDKYSLDFNLAMHGFTYRTSILKEMNIDITEKCFYVDTEYTIYPLQFIKTVVALDFPVYMYLLGSEEQSMNIYNLQKRREQHKKILLILSDYYEVFHNKFSENLNRLILIRIVNMALVQYYIFFTLGSNKSVEKEISTYDMQLKASSNKIYSQVVDIKNRRSKYVRLLRFINFKGYSVINRIISRFIKKSGTNNG